MKNKIKNEKIDKSGKYKNLPKTLQGEILLEAVRDKGKTVGYITATQAVCEDQMIQRPGENSVDFQNRLTKSGWLKHYVKFNSLPLET